LNLATFLALLDTAHLRIAAVTAALFDTKKYETNKGYFSAAFQRLGNCFDKRIKGSVLPEFL